MDFITTLGGAKLEAEKRDDNGICLNIYKYLSNVEIESRRCDEYISENKLEYEVMDGGA